MNPRKSSRKPRRNPSALMSRKSAARNLRIIARRLEVAQAAAAVTSSGLRCLLAGIDQHAAATTLQHCVCNQIAEQVNEIGWIITAIARIKEDQGDRDEIPGGAT